MKIEVIGSGCKKCKALFDLAVEVAKELSIKDAVEYSTDITKITAMGVMSSPVLAIDGKPVLVGTLPNKEKLKEIISGGLNKTDNNGKSCECSCGGEC